MMKGVFILLVGLTACTPIQPIKATDFTPTAFTSTTLPPSATTLPLQPTLTATAEITSTVDCHAQAGQVITDKFVSKVLPKPMAFRIYLPPCYEQDTNKRYPVLYLMHGLTYNDDQWQRLGVTTAADELIAAGAPGFIIVMPHDRSTAQPSLDPFDEALTGEFIPYIDSTYRTRADRRYRAIGGLSRGGGWAIHLALNNPDLFSAVGGHSPALFAEEDSFIPIWLKKIPAENMPLIALDIGDSDRTLSSVVEFEALLTKNNIPHEWHLYRGYHDEDYWSSHTKEYLKWYSDNWR
jgi:enterochelin esterase-like enzyme